MGKQRSVTRSIANKLFSIVLLSIFLTAIALTTIVSSLNDSKVINISGSLRMQNYRLAYDLTNHPESIPAHLAAYEKSLFSPALTQLNQFYVPSDVQHKYRALREQWERFAQFIRQGEQQRYLDNVRTYVDQIDDFVLSLQQYSEQKLFIVVLISLLWVMAIITLLLSAIHFTRKQIVSPMNRLVIASQQIKNGKFSFPPLDTELPNEIGVLSRAFTRMAGELKKLYRSLEEKVTEKTERLTQANRTLQILYDCSLSLNVSQISKKCFEDLLATISHHEKLSCIQLTINDSGSWTLSQGEARDNQDWQSIPLQHDERSLGWLRWQTTTTSPHPQLMQNIAHMLIRGLILYRAQKHYLQLSLMQERATIARELHDSLAQSLSYLRIQLTLLKRTISSPQQESSNEVIATLEEVLTKAYRQLRELLTTFRLTIPEADLHEALHELLAPMRSQTSASLELQCALSSHALSAQQQVHALQIVREAVLNAIKHANATQIQINCDHTELGENRFEILDDGCGIEQLEEPEGHYGLTIMEERTARLAGTLTISKSDHSNGTRVRLVFPQQG